MDKDDLNRMNLISCSEGSIFDNLIGTIIHLKGALNFDNTFIDIKVESIVNANNYPMAIVNQFYLATFEELMNLCKKKSLLRSVK